MGLTTMDLYQAMCDPTPHPAKARRQYTLQARQLAIWCPTLLALEQVAYDYGGAVCEPQWDATQGGWRCTVTLREEDTP